MRYQRTYRVSSGQVDILNHLSNVQYHEFFKSTIFALLHEHEFLDLVKPKRMFPVVFHDSCAFHKEVLFDAVVRVETYFSDLSEKHHKWWCHGVMYNEEEIQVATYKCHVGSMNLETRRIEPLPDKAVALILKYYANSDSATSGSNL